METFINFICENAIDAYWIMFLLLMLAGLNVPISEDVILLVSGIIASTCIPEHELNLFIWVWMGSYLSAWEAYWIGRWLGPKLYTIRWFSHVITEQRIARINEYYERFGIFTFIVGRFCPGGIRNGLFMSAGLGKMPFLKFIARDGLACFISSNVLFQIGYAFGENHEKLWKYFRAYQKGVLLTVAIAIGCLISYYMYKKSKTSA
jgi:membrane-associated protein